MAKSEVVYVNFDESDFLDVRKNILSSTISSISLLKKYKEFKALRKEEHKIKRELATELRSCYAEINHFIDSIPKSDIIPHVALIFILSSSCASLLLRKCLGRSKSTHPVKHKWFIEM